MPEGIQAAVQEHGIMLQEIIVESIILNPLKAGQLKVPAQVLKDLRRLM